MKRMISAFALLVSALLLSSVAVAQTSLWKVSKGDNYLYLGGTVHIISAKDLPFPKAFDEAYDDASVLVFETDISKLEDPAIQFKMMSSLAYQDGRLLNQVVSESLYNELNDYLVSRGLAANTFLTVKPAGVMLTMLAVEFQRLGITEDGADSYYFKIAQAEGKQIVGLELIDHHIEFLTAMGDGNEEQFLRQTLDDIPKTEALMDDIVQGWKLGDAKTLEKLVVTDMRDNFPKLYQSLLVDRNNNWLPIVRQMAETPEIELVLVGAAHLIGPDGLLEMLKAQGYSIQQM